MPTVLLVDDDVALLTRLAEQLTGAGYRALHANDISYAEHLLQSHEIDLMLIDPGIAHGAGWQLLERVAALLPVIAIGDGREEQVIRGLEAGAVDYIAKPVRPGELLARVRGRLRPAEGAAQRTAALEPPGAPEPPSDDLAQEEGDAPPQAASAAEAPPSRRARRSSSDAEEEEQVFMTMGEEQRLLNGELPVNVDELDPQTLAQLPLGNRLKAARQRRRITLVQAELDTRLRMYYIQAMEEEKFALLPRGPITEAMLRTYATYLGLDAAQALEEYRRLHYSAPVEPPPALGGLPAPRHVPRWVPITTAILLALIVGGGGIWLLDPVGVQMLASRARALVAPPTATPTPTSTLTPTVAPTDTATPSPSPSPSPSPTATATPTVSPTDTPEPSPTVTAAPRQPVRQPTAAPPPPTPEPPTPEPPTPEPPTPEPPAPEPPADEPPAPEAPADEAPAPES